MASAVEPILEAAKSHEEPLLESDRETLESQEASANSDSSWANVKFDTTLGCPMCMVADFGFKCVSATAVAVRNLVTGVAAKNGVKEFCPALYATQA